MTGKLCIAGLWSDKSASECDQAVSPSRGALKSDRVRWPDVRQACIVAPNHISYFDGPYLAFRSPRPLLFAVDPDFARSRFWRPILGLISKLSGCDYVAVGDGSPHGVRLLIRHLNSGGWVCVFPEGSIRLDGHAPGPCRPGAKWLSRVTGAPIVDVLLLPRFRGRGGKFRIPKIAGLNPTGSDGNY